MNNYSLIQRNITTVFAKASFNVRTRLADNEVFSYRFNKSEKNYREKLDDIYFKFFSLVIISSKTTKKNDIHCTSVFQHIV